MKILIIGGTGVLSSAVTAEALKQGITVTMINRGKRKLPDGAEVIISDNKDYANVRKLLSGRFFDAVIDFLCYKPEELKDSFNLYAPLCKQYFFISSCAVYDTTRPGIYEEDARKVTRSWPYSVEKWECEELLSKLSAERNSVYTVVRPCLTYGDTRLPYGLVPEFRKHRTFIERIKAGKPIPRWNKGENRWNVMRVEDFAVGVVGLIGNERAYNQAFNICGDETPSNGDVLAAVANVLHHDVKIRDMPVDFFCSNLPQGLRGEFIGGRAANLICSNAKIKSVVPAFRQNIPLESGVAMTIAAYLKDSQLGIDWFYEATMDRLVDKWERMNSMPKSKRSVLGFVNYLDAGNATDYGWYWAVRLNGTCCGLILRTLLRIVGKLSRILGGR